MVQDHIEDEILDFIQDAGTKISSLESENKTLRNKVNSLETERLRLEKVAAVAASKAFSIDREHLNSTFQNLKSLKLLSDTGFQKAASVAAGSPDFLLDVIDSLVDRMFKMASLQETVTMISPTIESLRSDEDPDALWRKFAKQKKF